MANDERIALVDQDDNVIGSKWRSELTDDECWRGISVWVENDKGEVLIQQRSLSKKSSPGMWTPAADGTVPEDSDHDTTAQNEIAEEIGLTGVKLTKGNKLHAKYGFGWRQMQGYITTCNWPIEKFVIQEEEVADLQWTNKQQVLDEITGKTPHTREWPDSCKYWVELFNLV